MFWVVGVSKHHCPGDGPGLQSALAFVRTALIVLGREIDRVALEGSLQLVSIKIPAQFLSLLLQLHPIMDRRPEIVRRDRPAPGDIGLRNTQRFLCAAFQQTSWNK